MPDGKKGCLHHGSADKILVKAVSVLQPRIKIVGHHLVVIKLGLERIEVRQTEVMVNERGRKKFVITPSICLDQIVPVSQVIVCEDKKKEDNQNFSEGRNEVFS